ncbi:hypothetical protein ERO13_A11G062601v2 [Gossypium hirsutum]|nr:hypothetical protein ERO13_A11G062601v2 [Gossypium hirsutum]
MLCLYIRDLLVFLCTSSVLAIELLFLLRELRAGDLHVMKDKIMLVLLEVSIKVWISVAGILYKDMLRVKALHIWDMDVVVEPGIGWMELNEYLEPYGLFFPLDPGPGATIGGMCATRCSGSLAMM